MMQLSNPRYGYITNLVHRLLAKHRDIVGKCVDIRGLAAQLGIQIIEQELELTLDGAAIRQGQRRTILINANQPTCRKTFSIAHEIGHLILHSDILSVDEEIHHRGPKSTEGRDPKEIEANFFAASILMPEFLIRRVIEAEGIVRMSDDNIAALASKFGVSAQALAIRLSSIGLV